MSKDIAVTVWCTAYNHAKYIKDTLEGFVQQNTSFRYEVIVHDDASTDGTADIIRQYESLYPEIIKGIYQTENQHSKKISYANNFFLPATNGKYIARCEGDDYWITPDKLQLQYDYMESHPECAVCFTDAYALDAETGEQKDFFPWIPEDAKYFKNKETVYDLDDFYKLTVVPFASIFFRTDDFNRLPESFQISCPAGDLKQRLFLTAFGKSAYLPVKTAVYRFNVPNSATTKWKQQPRESAFKRQQSIMSMIDNVDSFSEHQHHEGLQKLKEQFITAALNFASSPSILKKPEFKKVFKSLSIKRKLVILFKMIVPERFLALLKKAI